MTMVDLDMAQYQIHNQHDIWSFLTKQDSMDCLMYLVMVWKYVLQKYCSLFAHLLNSLNLPLTLYLRVVNRYQRIPLDLLQPYEYHDNYFHLGIHYCFLDYINLEAMVILEEDDIRECEKELLMKAMYSLFIFAGGPIHSVETDILIYLGFYLLKGIWGQ